MATNENGYEKILLPRRKVWPFRPVRTGHLQALAYTKKDIHYLQAFVNAFSLSNVPKNALFRSLLLIKSCSRREEKNMKDAPGLS
jgi:hypothetical protein